MKPRIFLAAFAATALLPIAAPAESPAPTVPTAPAAPSTDELQVAAASVVQQQVVQVLQAQSNTPSRMEFSRRRIVRPTYALRMTSTAPGGVVLSQDRIPFEVRRSEEAVEALTPVLQGYYDMASKSVQLYEPLRRGYLAAAEHPMMKNLAAKQ